MDAITVSLPADVIEEITRRVVEAAATQVQQYRVPDLLTTAQAAEYLNCKPQRIHDLRSLGDLPSFKFGESVWPPSAGRARGKPDLRVGLSFPVRNWVGL